MLGSGISSESIWTAFDTTTTATVRKIVGKVLVAWTRVANVTNYATVGASLVGGTDIVAGLGDVALNSADSFDYFDETDRVLRIEYERNLIEPLGGMTQAMFDVVLDNSDHRFTPNYNSTIGTTIKPNRPLKLFIGFEVAGQEKIIPIIEGLTLQPKENKGARTVSISGYDYLQWLNEKPQETTIYENQRMDQIVEDILNRAGIGSSSFVLDQCLNTIGFAWFEKGSTAGKRIKDLCEAEEAIFYQDENGVLRLENRDKYAQAPYNSVVWNIDPSDIISWEYDYSSKIINRVIVNGAPRSVKGESEIWKNGLEEEIGVGETKTIWASFEDPVTSMTSPSQYTDFTAYSGTGGAGSDLTGDIAITLTEFTKSAKLEITNNSGSVAYLNFLRLRGTPATVDYTITEIVQDTESISSFNEQQLEVDNPYIDDRNFAASMARNLVRRHKDQADIVKLTIRGVPQLQLRDRVRAKDQDLNTYDEYRVIGIQGILENGGFTQTLKLRRITSNEAL